MRENDRPLRHRKARDRALILPLVGAMLLLPPIAQVFEIDARIGGVPLPVIYVFAVWAALIAGTAALSRHLGEPEPPADDADGGPAPLPDPDGGRGSERWPGGPG